MKTLIAGVLLAAAFPVLADGKATITSNESGKTTQMVIQWSGENMRMDFPAQQGNYMLMRDGKGYMVSEQGGQTVVMDLARIKGLADTLGAKGGTVSSTQAQSVDSLEATGEDKTVAGIEGELYRIRWTDKNGDAHDDPIVVSDDPLSRELLQSFQDYIEIVMGAPDPIAATLIDRELGTLEFADKFKIVEIADTAPGDDTFKLPDNAMTMQEMLKQHMGNTNGTQ